MSFGLLKNATPPIAVDFGVSALKVLQIVPGNSPTLVGAVSLETPINFLNKGPERLIFQAQALPELLKQANFRGRRAICSVSATLTFVHHLRVQPIPGTPVPHLLGEQIQQYSDRDPSQFILRHVEVGEINRGGRKMIEVLCIGIPRDAVLTHMKALRGAKLEPVGVHTEHVALVRSLDHIHRRAADRAKVTMLIDFGYASTKIAVSHGRDPVFAKTLMVGGFHFDKATSRAYGCSFKEARERRAAHVAELRNPSQSEMASAGADAGHAQRTAVMGGSDQTQHSSATALADEASFDPELGEERRRGAPAPNLASLEEQAAPVAEAGANALDLMNALTEEIVLAVRYHAALFRDRPIDQLVFTGGESARTDLCSMAAERVNLPGHVADPLRVIKRGRVKGVGVNLDEPAPGWAVPLGLCNAPTDL